MTMKAVRQLKLMPLFLLLRSGSSFSAARTAANPNAAKRNAGEV